MAYTTHAIDNEYDRSNPYPSLYARCGKSRMHFAVNEWIASECQDITCEQCLRFLAESKTEGGEKTMIRIKHCGASLNCNNHANSGGNVPVGAMFTVTMRHGDPRECSIGVCYVEDDGCLDVGKTYRIVAADVVYWDVEEVRADMAAPTTFVVKHANARVGSHCGNDVPIGTIISFKSMRGSDKWMHLADNPDGQGVAAADCPVPPRLHVKYRITAIGSGTDCYNGTWTLEEVAGTPAPTTSPIVIKESELFSTGVAIPPSREDQGTLMVFTGVVVRTKTIAAGEGVTTGVQKAEVVYVTKKPVTASSAEQAKAIVLAQAIVELKGDLDLEDTTKPVVVQLAQFNL